MYITLYWIASNALIYVSMEVISMYPHEHVFPYIDIEALKL